MMVVKVDPHRLQESVDLLTRFPVEKGKILLYGSSFFTVWGHERAAAQMDGEVVNHGFGGSTAEELVYYYQTLVKPYEPRALILRSGVNDVGAGYTGKQSAKLVQRVCEWAAYDFDGIRIGLLPSFDCPWLDKQDKEHKREHADYNRRLSQYASEHENVEYLDIRPFFYEENGKVGSFEHLRSDLFQPDGLHMTDFGYEAFAPYFKQLLRENYFLK